MDLFVAAKYGDIGQVQKLVQQGVGVDSRNRCNQSPLYFACENGHAEVAAFLLSKGATVNRGAKPLIAAARNGHYKCAEVLLKHGAFANCTNTKGDTPFSVAWSHHNFTVVELLLNHGAFSTVGMSSNVADQLFRFHDADVPVGLVKKFLYDGMTLGNNRQTILSAAHYAFKHGMHEFALQLFATETDVNIQKDYSFALYFCAENNWIDMVTKLLDKGIDVNVSDESPTALYGACKKGYLDIVKLLLSQGANPNLRNKDGNTYSFPLHVASENGHLAVVKYLIENGAVIEVHRPDELAYNRAIMHRGHPLHIAFDSGHMEICNYLLSKEANVNVKDLQGLTMLHKACSQGCVDKVDVVLKFGADVNYESNTGESALHLACCPTLKHVEPSYRVLAKKLEQTTTENDCNAILRLLLANGATVNVLSAHGDTPLYRACHARLTEAAKILLDAGADPNLTTSSYFPLLAACMNGDVEMAKQLINAGADVKCMNAHQATVLHVLFSNHHTVPRELLQLLLKFGPDVNLLSSDGHTPLYLAAVHQLPEAVRMLLEAGADANIPRQCCPLIAACEDGCKEIVELLIDAGADVNTMSDTPTTATSGRPKLPPNVTSSSTPLCAAVKRGHADIVDLLLKHGALVDQSTVSAKAPLICAVESLISEASNHIMDVTKSKYYRIIKSLLSLNPDVNTLADSRSRPLLYDACSAGLHVLVQDLLQHGADPNQVTSDGKTALYAACKCKHEQVVEMLLSNGASPNLTDVRGGRRGHHDLSYGSRSSFEPLGCLAAKTGNLPIMQSLLKHGLDANRMDDSGKAALHYVTDGNMVKTLLEFKADINIVSKDGETPLSSACRRDLLNVSETLLLSGADPNYICAKLPLHTACENSNVQMTELLLKSGAKPNLSNQASRTANGDRLLPVLHIACERDNQDIVSCLLKFGADVTAVNWKGETPLHYAIKYQNKWKRNQVGGFAVKTCQTDVLDCLLGSNANVNAIDAEGKTPLYLACEKGSREIVSKLLSSGADANLTSSQCYPLQVSCERENTDIILLLLNHGANPNVARNRRYPLFTAAEKCDSKLAEAFLQHGANVRVTDEAGNTALHLAVKDQGYSSADKCFNMLRILLTSGADPNAQNIKGKTPLHVACSCSSVDLRVVELLLSSGANPNILPSVSHKVYIDSEAVQPLAKAAISNNGILLNLLIKHGAKIDQVDAHGKTALHYAVERDYYISELSHESELSCVDILLAAGARVNVVSNNGETPLFVACEKGKRDLVNKLFKHKADPNLFSYDKLPLCSACRKQQTEIVDLLLANGANPNKRPKNVSKKTRGQHVKPANFNPAAFISPLSVIAQIHNSSIMEKLLQHGASVNVQDEFGKTALHHALQPRSEFVKCRTDDRCVDLLIEHGADADLLSNAGETPLYLACSQGLTNVVQKMLEHGADACLGNGCKFPLVVACEKLQTDMVKLLLANGANPNLVELTDDSECLRSFSVLPVCIAASKGNVELVSLLFKHGARLNAIDLTGATAIHFALKYHLRNLFTSVTETENVKSVVDFLLENGADVNITDGQGATALYIAAEAGRSDIASDLLKHGANPNLTTTDKYPLCAACEGKNLKLVELLLSSGANPDLPSHSKGVNHALKSPSKACTSHSLATFLHRVTLHTQSTMIKSAPPLCIATAKGFCDIFNVLLKSGAYVDSCDANGLTALQIAVEKLTDSLQHFYSSINVDGQTIVMIQQLLEAGADPNQLNSDRVSPLHSLLTALFNFRTYLLHSHPERLKYADIAQLIITLTHHGANIDDALCNLGTYRHEHLKLEDFMITFSQQNEFITELLKAGAGYKLLSLCCKLSRRMSSQSVDISLCKAVVMAGTPIGTFDQNDLQQMEESDDVDPVKVELLSWMNEEKQTAPSLLRQCRVSIRQQLSVASQYTSIIHSIDKLPLPEQLRRYLKFEGLLTEVDLSVSADVSSEESPETLQEEAMLERYRYLTVHALTDYSWFVDAYDDYMDDVYDDDDDSYPLHYSDPSGDEFCYDSDY